MAEFTGFPPQTLTFLRGLELDNSKDWFEAHRDEYEAHWLSSAKRFVEAAGEALVEIAPDIRAEPRVNGSIFRINRDIRFSRDKTPYKTTLDLWFWEGERRTAVSGFFIRVASTYLVVGAGSHGFDRDRISAYRDAVVDRKAGRRLVVAVDAVEGAGVPVKGEQYKAVPKGYEPRSETQARLLRHGALWCGEDEPIPDVLHDARLVDHAMGRWRTFEPVHRWLVDSVR